MALYLLKILTIFGNLQRAVDHSLKWLKKACSARLYDTIKTAFIKKVWSPVGPQQSHRGTSAVMTTETLMQTSFVPKLTRYSFKFHVELDLKTKRSNNGRLPKC